MYAAQAAMSARQAADDLLLWHRDVLIRFEFAGPKGLYKAARYENFELTTPAQHFALASVKGDLWPQPDEPWPLMTLAGPPGSGKTHLGAAWFAEQTVADMHAHFIDEFITPYSPEQNGMVERVIRTLKDQCVHRHRYETLQHASRVIAD